MAVGEWAGTHWVDSSLDRSVRRLAVLRPTGLDELLQAVPALRALRAGFPDAEITLISHPWASEFATRFGHYVDRFVPFYGFPDPRDHAVGPFSSQSKPRTDDQRYDLVVQLLDGRERSNAWARALGGRMTVGFYAGAAPDYLTLAVSYPRRMSEVDRLLRLTRMIGCPETDDAIEFPLYIEDHREARRKLFRVRQMSAPSVALYASDGIDIERAATVADGLSNLGHAVALLGPDARSVHARMIAPAVSFGEYLSLGTVAAIFERMSLVVSTDPNMQRLAEAVGTPTLPLPDGQVQAYLTRADMLLTENAAVS